MAGFSEIEEIKVWQESINFCVYVYELINGSDRFKKDFGLKDQMQRASVSIPSNISEGFERESKAEFIRFLHISKGSCGELRSQFLIAYKLRYINKKDFDYADDKCRYISSMIANLIKALKRRTEKREMCKRKNGRMVKREGGRV